MTGVLAAGGLAILAADVWLVVICWKHRTALGAVGGVVGIPLVLFAVLSGLAGGTAKASLGIALMFLILGACLYGLGHALERLLDEEAENTTLSDHGEHRIQSEAVGLEHSVEQLTLDGFDAGATARRA